MAESAEVIVTLAPGTSPADVEARLHAQGFTTTSLLSELAMIVGHAPEESVEALRGVEGVAAVEPSQPIQLPPDGPQ